MADVNRDSRPLSPHMTIYRPQWTTITSILHRITGIGLSVGAILAVWWFLGLANGAEPFATADGWITSWIGNLVLIGSVWALWYHFCTGVRHLVWDTGMGFDPETVELSGKVVVGASVALTLLTILMA